jgi:hypothetical protein
MGSKRKPTRIAHVGGYGGDPRTGGLRRDLQGNYLDPMEPFPNYNACSKLVHQNSPATREAIARWRMNRG